MNIAVTSFRDDARWFVVLAPYGTSHRRKSMLVQGEAVEVKTYNLYLFPRSFASAPYFAKLSTSDMNLYLPHYSTHHLSFWLVR